jgi:hypothetical protein
MFVIIHVPVGDAVGVRPDAVASSATMIDTMKLANMMEYFDNIY